MSRCKPPVPVSTHAVLATSGTGLTVPDTRSVVDALTHSGSVDVVDAVLVCRQDGRLQLAVAHEPGHDEIHVAAWRWFLDGVLGGPGAGPRSAVMPTAGWGLGESLLIELREVLTASAAWLVMITSRLDAGAAVAALRRFPGTRLVYGPLQPRVLDELMRWTVPE